ncbi:MAG: DNA mismatch repair endonuclease MutL [Chloroflexota bacterium]|nr:DNA mismatch repair endonuclease MutL [Chloroflexota bacterium]
MPIRLLSPSVSSKIAAGEVIERPASVAKELLENSIDAGATIISMDLRGGGIENLRISDNGCGIPRDELELAFRRFATSKVSDSIDLDSIGTLGFRGEALPSIGAVSTVTLASCTREQKFGSAINVIEGIIGEKTDHSVSNGTTVTVQNLFKNVPARLKFLRSEATETSRIHNILTRYAMAYPEISFDLRIDGKQNFRSSGSGDLREVIASVYNSKIADSMIELGSGDITVDGEPSVGGMICSPYTNRANRSYISFFVNRRWVQNRMLSVAVEQAYHGFMKERRYPITIIDIKLPLTDVDVNFHPGKSEVRFSSEGNVFGTLQRSVRDALSSHTPVPNVTHKSFRVQHDHLQASGLKFWPIEPFIPSNRQSPNTSPIVSDADSPQVKESVEVTPGKVLPVLRVVGQIKTTYIITEGPEGLYLIDQHAAHERVLFERIKNDMSTDKHPASQSLLEPVLVKLDEVHKELLSEHSQILLSLGMVIEPFGDSTYLLRAVPAPLGDIQPEQVLIEILDTMNEGGGFDSWNERAAFSVACHGAIRAGKVMSREEMEELIRQLEECHQPNTCPHGRPTMLELSNKQIEREFGRT